MQHNPASRTFVQTLIERAERTPERLAYVFLGDGEHESGRQTYAELDSAARRIAGLLRRRFVARERALLLYSDGLDFIQAFFGCLYAGIIPVPTYPPLRGKRLSVCSHIARTSTASLVLTTCDQVAALRKALSQDSLLARLPLLTTDIHEAAPIDQVWRAPTDREIAFIQFTSGSTGHPKGVMVTHGSLANNEQVIARAFEHDLNSVFVGWLPLFHDMGLIGNVLQPMHMGIPGVLMPPAAFLQKPVRWLEAISKYGGTSSGAPNFAYDLCVARVTEAQKTGLDLSSWTVAFNGAEPLLPETLKRFTDAFAACGFSQRAHYPCYGMAEATLLVAGGKVGAQRTLSVSASELEQHRVRIAEPSDVRAKELVSCGHAWLGNELKIVDPTTCLEVESDGVGEIWLSGPSVTAGYWGEPELTEAAYAARLRGDPTDRAWLRTGDLGFMHGGELYFTGRSQDLLAIDGRYLYPNDLELTAEYSSEHVARGRVAAFALPGDRVVIAAEVSFSARAVANPERVATAIRDAITERHNVAPADVCVLRPSTLPLTSSGKVRRRACRALYRAHGLERFERAALRGSAANTVLAEPSASLDS
jgi:acyl-CoA synthetase (AMP-forming)/AMP-acid ligase II